MDNAEPQISPRKPVSEQERIKVLRQYTVLDTEPDDELDNLAALAARICDAPIALISLIDEERQWFKARVGINTSETPRRHSFCAHALEQTDVLVVPDAETDERFARNPLVTGAPGIRFYAGAPLLSPDNAVLGTLCVIDRVPRQISESQKWALTALAQQVINKLEPLRRRAELHLGADGELAIGLHQLSLKQLQSLVCTSTHRGAQWLRLLAFLAEPILSQKFSHAYITGPLLSNNASTTAATVTLQTREPYGPDALAALQPYLDIGQQRIFDLCSIELRIWVENRPAETTDHDSFFWMEQPWLVPGGPVFPVVQIDLSDADIIPQFRRGLDPIESWKIPRPSHFAKESQSKSQ